MRKKAKSPKEVKTSIKDLLSYADVSVPTVTAKLECSECDDGFVGEGLSPKEAIADLRKQIRNQGWKIIFDPEMNDGLYLYCKRCAQELGKF